jgi:hypothetical protein
MKTKMVLAGIGCVLILSLMGCATIKKTTETIYSGEKSVADYENVLEQNPNGVFANRNGEQIRTQIISFQFIRSGV